MRYADDKTEAAFVLAHEHGRAVTEVGTLSLDGDGMIWQALVALNRTAMLVTNEYDNYSRAVKPGHDYLVWLVEDEPGHVITHKMIDVDRSPDAIEPLMTEFEAITTHYTEGVSQ
jgi:hypothetical protein